MQNSIRVFTRAQDYEAYVAAEEQAVKQRHIEEARQRARSQPRQLPSVFTPKVQRSLAEVERFIHDVLTRADVAAEEKQARRHARNIRVFRGGLPGLGHR